jgi:hypothetical protein
MARNFARKQKNRLNRPPEVCENKKIIETVR